MSNFTNFASFNTFKIQPTRVNFTLNISKKSSPKETILGYTHNGIVFASHKNDSSWIQFHAISSKQGASHMTLTHEGQEYSISAEKFWCQMFSCQSVDQLPDIKVKVNLGDITAGEEILEQGQGKALRISIDPAALKLSTGEYKGEPIVYLSPSTAELSLVQTVGRTVDVKWVMTCLGNAVVQSTTGKEFLSRYRRVGVAAPQAIHTVAAPASAPVVAKPAVNVVETALASITTAPAQQMAVESQYDVDVDLSEGDAVDEDWFEDEAPKVEELKTSPGQGFGTATTATAEQTTVATEQPDDWSDEDFDSLVDAEDETPASSSNTQTLDVMNLLQQADANKANTENFM